MSIIDTSLSYMTVAPPKTQWPEGSIVPSRIRSFGDDDAAVGRTENAIRDARSEHIVEAHARRA